MEKSIFAQIGGTYEQQGDYMIPYLALPPQEKQIIGIWGQRHARYLKQHHRILYYNLLTSGKREAERSSCRNRPAGRGNIFSADKADGKL